MCGVKMGDDLPRCSWASGSEIERTYHDTEWGRPLHDERKLFELLMLEGKQAGLSWYTILSRRELLRVAFDGFDPQKMAAYDEDKLGLLLSTEGVIKNRLKVRASVTNAQAYFKLCDRFRSLDAFLWSYVDGKAIQNEWESVSEVPAQTDLSNKISRDLKALGFKFVGATIIYAFMQSIGMVNDHLTSCFVYDEVRAL